MAGPGLEGRAGPGDGGLEGPSADRPGALELLGLRRGGPAPPETRAGAPLRPLTLANIVGYVRLAMVIALLVIALPSDDGRVTGATFLFCAAAALDYLDGLLARLTGRYSRLGALMDPLADRLLVVSGAIVAWRFELLPRWALALLAARELLMVGLASFGLRRGLDIEINWIGRLAVWPTMGAIGLALIADTWLAEALLYVGLAAAFAATVLYVRTALRRLRIGS